MHLCHETSTACRYHDLSKVQQDAPTEKPSKPLIITASVLDVWGLDAYFCIAKVPQFPESRYTNAT